ncbi:MAG: glycosyltransferase, partial [Thermoplasmatales archaeon]
PLLMKSIEDDVRIPYEIVFVDDISTDGTRDFILDYARSHGNIKYIFSEEKKGTAIARYRGTLEASNVYIIIMDSDNQHPPHMINEIAKQLYQGYDVVLCSRFISGGSTGNRKAVRGLISRIASLIVRLTLRKARHLSDPLSNFIGFRSSIKLPAVEWEGYEIQLAIFSSNDHLNIKEIPYVFREREIGKSSLTSSYRFIPVFLKEIFIYRKFERVAKYTHIHDGDSDVSRR